MASLNGYYLNKHITQFDGSRYAGENCTPTSGANGVAASTGGKIVRSGAYIRSLVPRWAETDPSNPGWSLTDLDRAMRYIGVGFDIKSGQGWSTAMNLLGGGHYLVIQGESWVFSNNTCSGAFNGRHAIGVHPATRVISLRRQHWIDDPICKTGRWEYDSVIRKYATSISTAILFGAYTNKVPRTNIAPNAGGPMIIPQQLIHVVTTKETRIYSAPNLAAGTPSTLPAGRKLRKFGGFVGWQMVQVNYGGKQQYVWVKSDSVKLHSEPLTVIDGTCP